MSKSLPIEPGRYLAKCRDKSLLSAVANGHSLVFPEAECVLRSTQADFFKGGKRVWSCNALYATTHFDLSSLP